MARRWPIAAIGALVAVGLATAYFFDVPAVVDALRDWVWRLGQVAPAAYALLYVAATLVGVPATPLVIVAALLFGPVLAFFAMAAGSTLSAMLAFLLARSTARAPLGERLQQSGASARLCRLVERYDALVIPVARLAPVLPFAAVNYGMGLTGIGFWRYTLWSAVAIAVSDGVLVFGTGALYGALSGAGMRWPILAGAALALLAALALVAIGRRRSLPGRTDRWATAPRRRQWRRGEAADPTCR
jgi:uncharacterized membrane protein YdjX (TVP38/TMEM64 family)